MIRKSSTFSNEDDLVQSSPVQLMMSLHHVLILLLLPSELTRDVTLFFDALFRVM